MCRMEILHLEDEIFKEIVAFKPIVKSVTGQNSIFSQFEAFIALVVEVKYCFLGICCEKANNY